MGPLIRTRILLLVLTTLLQVACATDRVIRDNQYESAVNAYRFGDIKLAEEKFPEGESGGFITSVEKSWLGIWQKRWAPQSLQKQVSTFDQRHFTSLTREAEYFILQEAEEGYVPSEHEIVVLHLISAIHFLQIHDPEGAKVELRRAGYILDRFWDDPALRIWLGALWAASGEWNEAQVDFRRAEKLQPNPKLKQLLEGRPPANLTLGFHGYAPAMQWKEGLYVPEFEMAGGEPREAAIRSSTLPWFQRHTQRNTVLRDVLIKSNFMAQYLGTSALTGTERGMSKTAAWTMKAGSVIAGAAIIIGGFYLMANTSAAVGDGRLPGAILALGAGVIVAGWQYANDFDRQMTEQIDELNRLRQKELRTYRVVRFLPGWISLSTEDRKAGIRADEVETESPAGATRLKLVNWY